MYETEGEDRGIPFLSDRVYEDEVDEMSMGLGVSGREDYNASPGLKRRMWEEIVEAAQYVIDHGGADIRFVPENAESRMLSATDRKPLQSRLQERRNNAEKTRTD